MLLAVVNVSLSTFFSTVGKEVLIFVEKRFGYISLEIDSQVHCLRNGTWLVTVPPELPKGHQGGCRSLPFFF